MDPAVGLDADEAARRLARHGPNRLREHRRRSVVRIAAAQFRSVIVALLAVAATLSLAFGSPVEAGAIAAVLLLNALIGFLTELRAVRSMEALRALGEVRSIVLREGTSREVPARELVPGDIVVLEGGDVVAADLRLVESSRLQVDESTLTGESVPVEKSVEAVPPDTPLAERTPMVHKGTAVTRGSGRGIVVATGMETELGRVSALVEEAREETTPLERRLAALGRRLVWVTLALAAVVAVSGLATGKDPLLVVETAIALAVAAIPEGLPIVATLALARGMWRMASRNALVERLSAVETLGSTTVIFTDKTGTLTESRMRVTVVALSDREMEIAGTGDEEASTARPAGGEVDLAGGEIDPTGREVGPTGDEGGRAGGGLDGPEGSDGPLDPGTDPALAALLRAVVLCNGAELREEAGGEGAGGVAGGAPGATGDPTEIALLELGARAGLRRRELLERWPETERTAFDPETAMMATIHRDATGGRRAGDGGPEAAPFLVAVKGAPEAVLEACTREFGAGGARELEGTRRRAWGERVDGLARRGLRLLAVAERHARELPADPFNGLTLLGLVGLLDPPRSDVRRAIEACRRAGIRVVMITGDHPLTGRAVAAAVGIAGPGEEALTGSVLDSPEEVGEEERRRLLETGVFARTSPEQKLRLLDLHREAGEVTAMIGDGVNDAPALERADIGVAMGIRGTPVAREAADMVLEDDRFGTIVAAIEQGRAIFANIRKFVVYLLSCNASEILVVTLASLAGAPIPLLPLQILFLNLVTDVFPALALGMVEGADDLLARPPRDPDEPILTASHWRAVAGYGLGLTAAVLTAFGLGLVWRDLPGEEAVTLSFLTLAFGQLLHVFNMSEPDSGVLRNEVTSSGTVHGAVLLSAALVLAVLLLPGAARLLGLVRPDTLGWTTVLLLAAAPLAGGRAWAAARGRR